MHIRPSRPRRTATLALALPLLGLSASCDSLPSAMGDVHAIVISASPALWGQVGAATLSSIERTVFTVRDERTFRALYVEPADSAWSRLYRLRQLLLIGKTSDVIMTGPLAALENPLAPPAIAQVRDLWSRGQLVTVLVLPDHTTVEEDAATVDAMLPELAGIFDAQFRDWVLGRMFATGPDTALARALAADHGFSVVVPEVYDHRVAGAAGEVVHVFRNDNPDPSELIRQLAVTWREGASQLDVDEMLEWRARIVDAHYDYPQVLDGGRVIAGPVEHHGRPAMRYQSVWQNPPDAYPAAGPFIVLAIPCPEQGRTYLLDAWLYAPGDDKYEYMIQLEEILDSFRCAGEAA